MTRLREADRKSSGRRLTYDGFGMTDRLQAAVASPIALKERLSGEDDPALWEQVLKVLAEDASIVEPVTDTSQLYAEEACVPIGCVLIRPGGLRPVVLRGRLGMAAPASAEPVFHSLIGASDCGSILLQ